MIVCEYIPTDIELRVTMAYADSLELKQQIQSMTAVGLPEKVAKLLISVQKALEER